MSLKTIANNFNKHFSSIAKHIEKKLIKAKSEFSKYLKEPTIDLSVSIQPIL